MAHLSKLKFSDKQRSQVKMTVEGVAARAAHGAKLAPELAPDAA